VSAWDLSIRLSSSLLAGLLGFACATGCGASQRPSSRETSCDAVAQHLVDIAEKDNQSSAPASLASGVRSESARQCRETPWTEERRRCLVAATMQEQTLACPER
jgi:hypothetical protein